MKSSVIVRFDDFKASQHKLNRIRGDVRAPSFIDLITGADLEANPRVAKKGAVTKEIEDCLTDCPELFHYKSKGLLVACREVELLERNRVRLRFEDPELEGILDGGHNTLAIARYILRQALGEEADLVLRKVKTWKELQPVWANYLDQIEAIRDEIDFLIPMEVIYPIDESDGCDEFTNAILDINRARNNNAQLTESTKANKSGYYEEIKKNLDINLARDVEWKSNDGGRIKSRDLVALSLIPLSVLPEDVFSSDASLKKKIDNLSTMIFSSKGNCVSLYNEMLQHEGISQKIENKGEIIEVVHEGVQSALVMMKDMPKLYDLIYEKMPISANNNGKKFGKITGVRFFEADNVRSDNPKHLKRPPKTKFYSREVKFDYGEGFIMPLVFALRELMECKQGVVSWKVNPYRFIEDHLDTIVDSYYGMMQGQNFDPAKVGKQQSSYKIAQDSFKVQVMLHANK
ncbi:AIPR family protein [Rosistilla ulvae]|uniref:AIPR family protein n=1 Tax=Rosistilla ulvae TaxID=1930277 RepID=UPI001C54EEAA|nr:AIPR family protein [Rosistilla ulvae]